MRLECTECYCRRLFQWHEPTNEESIRAILNSHDTLYLRNFIPTITRLGGFVFKFDQSYDDIAMKHHYHSSTDNRPKYGTNWSWLAGGNIIYKFHQNHSPVRSIPTVGTQHFTQYHGFLSFVTLHSTPCARGGIMCCQTNSYVVRYTDMEYLQDLSTRIKGTVREMDLAEIRFIP